MDKAKFENRKEWQKFGLTMASIQIVWGVYLTFYGRDSKIHLYLISIGILLILVSLAAPKILRPIYRFWMTLSFALGEIFTKIILIFTFYFLFTPLGLVFRIFKKDLLDQKIDKGTQSYWKKYEKITDKSRYENQF